jgi:hypothetical protein
VIASIEASCPHCNHSLLDQSHPLHGRPSIRLTTSFDLELGTVLLPSVRESPARELEPKISTGARLDFFCPHCHAELARGADCRGCGQPMVVLREGVAPIQLCPRPGCDSRPIAA